MGFEVKGQTGHDKVMTAQYLDNPLKFLDGHHTCTLVHRN
jgi:hypothetical protein